MPQRAATNGHVVRFVFVCCEFSEADYLFLGTTAASHPTMPQYINRPWSFRDWTQRSRGANHSETNRVTSATSLWQWSLAAVAVVARRQSKHRVNYLVHSGAPSGNHLGNTP